VPAEVGVEAIERAGRRGLGIVHGAGPEPAVPVRLAVVEAVFWSICFGIADRLEALARQVEEVEARGHRYDQAAGLAHRE
jgi:hypothetical protein